MFFNNVYVLYVRQYIHEIKTNITEINYNALEGSTSFKFILMTDLTSSKLFRLLRSNDYEDKVNSRRHFYHCTLKRF